MATEVNSNPAMVRAAAIVGVVFLYGGWHPFLYWPGAEPWRRLVMAAVYGIALIGVWAGRHQLVRIGPRLLLILGPVLLAVASLAWTRSVPQTVMWAAGLIGTTAVGLCLGLQADQRLRHVRIVAAAAGLAMVLSLIAVVVAPHQAIGHPTNPDAWRGTFSHKNVLGFAAALAAVTLSMQEVLRPCPLRVLAVGIASALVWQSRSVTALGVLVLVALVRIVLFIGAEHRARRRIVLVVAGALGLTLLFAAGTRPAAALAVVGRDPSLTGRVEAWRVALALISERPLLGWGYGAVSSHDPTGTSPLTSRVSWAPEHAHNGYLDVTLELGWVGLASYLVALIVVGRAILPKMWDRVDAAWGVLVVVLLLASNLAESTLLRANRMEWALLVALALAGCRPQGFDDLASPNGSSPA